MGTDVSEQTTDDALRRGIWTSEEESYASLLIEEFKAGYLPIQNGVTLRSFLSKILQCKPKRVSKKFERSKYNGKRAFERKQEKLPTGEADRREAKLKELELKFLMSLPTMKPIAKIGTVKKQIFNAEAPSMHRINDAPAAPIASISAPYSARAVTVTTPSQLLPGSFSALQGSASPSPTTGSSLLALPAISPWSASLLVGHASSLLAQGDVWLPREHEFSRLLQDEFIRNAHRNLVMPNTTGPSTRGVAVDEQGSLLRALLILSGSSFRAQQEQVIAARSISAEAKRRALLVDFLLSRHMHYPNHIPQTASAAVTNSRQVFPNHDRPEHKKRRMI